jgi:hypothetical protein
MRLWVQGLTVLVRTFVVAAEVAGAGVVEVGCMAASLSFARQKGARATNVTSVAWTFARV